MAGQLLHAAIVNEGERIRRTQVAKDIERVKRAEALEAEELEQRMRRVGYAAVSVTALILLVAMLLLSGCSCDSRIRESVAKFRSDFATYRAAVVPNPRYDEEGKAAVERLGADLMNQADKIVEASEQ